jgi:transcriptional regulator with XRE-family HTH domain
MNETAGYAKRSVFGLERSTVAKWETDASKPRADLLPKIADLYNCTIDELLRDDKTVSDGCTIDDLLAEGNAGQPPSGGGCADTDWSKA